MAAFEDPVDSCLDLLDSPNDSRFHSRWLDEPSLPDLPWSRVVPAQMEDRGREMVTRVTTLEDNSGTMMAY